MKKIVLLCAFVFCFSALLAQKKGGTVSGIVTDAISKQTLENVLVKVRGTNRSVKTDKKGNYKIGIPKGSTMLIFKYKGKATQQIRFTGQKTINVALENVKSIFDSTVVDRYEQPSYPSQTGAFSTTEPKFIPQNTSIDAYWQGAQVGLWVQNASRLGDANLLRLRGIKSILSSNQPLIFVDNMPITTEGIGDGQANPINLLADLNPADIENIQILRTPDGMYASRSANGVILIQTKQGKSSKPTWNLGYSMGFSSPTIERKMMDSKTYLEFLTNSIENRRKKDDDFLLTKEEIFDAEIPYWKQNQTTNWEDKVLQKGSSQVFSLSVGGKKEALRYYASMGYQKQKGILQANDYQRFSARTNIQYAYSQRLLVGLQYQFAHTQMNRLMPDTSIASPMRMLALPPLKPDVEEETPTNEAWYMPNGSSALNNGFFDTQNNRQLAKLYSRYEIKPNLVWQNEWNIDFVDLQEKRYQGFYTKEGASHQGIGNQYSAANLNFSAHQSLNFQQHLSATIALNSIVGLAYQHSSALLSQLRGTGFPMDNMSSISQAANITQYQNYKSNFLYASAYMRNALIFNEKITATLGISADQSSRFGTNNPRALYGNVGLAWDITKENFADSSKVMRLLKVRLNAGTSGNSAFGNYTSKGLYVNTNYAGNYGITPYTLANPNLKPEKTLSINAGLDFVVLKGFVSGSIDVYTQQSSDVLMAVKVPLTSGYSEAIKNIGKISNSGFELQLNTLNLQGEIHWTSSLQVAYNQNKVSQTHTPITEVGMGSAIIENEPLGAFYMPVYVGIDAETGDALFETEGGQKTNDYSKAAKKVVGSPLPKWIGGIGNTLRYGDFELDMLWQFQLGQKLYDAEAQFAAQHSFANKPESLNNAWKNEKEIGNYPEWRFGMENGNQVSSLWVKDASFWRLRHVRLGYSIPKENLEKMKLSSLQLYLIAQNWLTFSPYKDADPESNSFMGSNTLYGTLFYAAPQTKSISVGVSVGF